MLFDWHESHGAKIVDFAGWEMPVQYETGTIAEHLATRRHAGLFDVSHMGRFRFTGPNARAHLSYVLTNDPDGLRPGEAHYTYIANENGGAIAAFAPSGLSLDVYAHVLNRWLVEYLFDAGDDIGVETF